jgi:hypothetical protein
MPDIIITIPTDKVDLIKNAIGYQETIIDDEGNEVPNPESALAYAEKVLIKHLKNQVRRYEKQLAVRNATYTDINVT